MFYPPPTLERPSTSERLPLLEDETTPPEPITIAEAREELRIPLDDEDHRIENLLISGRQWLEQQYKLALIPGRHRCIVPLTRTGRLDLPVHPVTEVLTVERRDGADGEPTALETSDWWADLDYRPARVWIRSGCVGGVYVVTCATGWTAQDIPGPLKEAIAYRAWGYLDRVPTEDWMRVVRPAVAPFAVRSI